MRKKFVQVAFILCAVVLLASIGASAAEWFMPNDPYSDPYPAVTDDPLQYPGQTVLPGYSGAGDQLMRIGVYYGSSGKESIDLTQVTGDGFYIGVYDVNNVFTPVTNTASSQLTVSAASGGMIVTDGQTGMILYQDTSNSLGIEPYSMTGEKPVTKCGYPYYGSFRFECFQSYPGKMTIVNMVRLDDYVEGVVPYESSPSWHIEALKAQAVCARTYALAHVKETHQNAFHFDLCDSDCCQVYKGVYSGSQADKVAQSVEQTAGITMTYNGEYCDAVYSSSNGGGSESAINVWGKDIPYLIGKTDPYEETIADTIPKYAWSVVFTGEELQAKLIAEGRVNCGVITEVRTTVSETGNVLSLTFLDNNGKSWTVYNTDRSGSRCRTMLSLRSLHYTVTGNNGGTTSSIGAPGSSADLTVNGAGQLDPSGGISVINGDGTVSVITGGYIVTDSGVSEIGTVSSVPSSGASGTSFTFQGTGWGHNVGLSQYGACAMAQMGYDYQDILRFYYTGVTIG